MDPKIEKESLKKASIILSQLKSDNNGLEKINALLDSIKDKDYADSLNEFEKLFGADSFYLKKLIDKNPPINTEINIKSSFFNAHTFLSMVWGAVPDQCNS